MVLLPHQRRWTSRKYKQLLVNAQTVERTLAVCAGAHTFTEVLGRAKRVIQDAMEHADVPFARVVEAARVSRSTAYTPVFQTMMTLQGAVRGTQMAGAALALASLEVGGMEEVRSRDTRTNLAGL